MGEARGGEQAGGGGMCQREAAAAGDRRGSAHPPLMKTGPPCSMSRYSVVLQDSLQALLQGSLILDSLGNS